MIDPASAAPPVPLTDAQAFMRRRLLVALNYSASRAADATISNERYFWTLAHRREVDELAAFDRREGIWWEVVDGH